MNKPKVLHLLSSGNYSGAEKIAINIIEATNDDVQSYYASPQGIICEILSSKKIKHITWNHLSIFKLRQIIKSLNVSIIHAHDFRASIIASICMTNAKIVSHLHQNPPWLFHFNILSVVYFVSSIRFSKIVFVSSWNFGNSKMFKLIKKKAIVIENYINTSEIIEKSNSFFVPKYDIIYLGRLSKEKDPIKFLRIIKKISELKIDISVAMVGDGPLNSECKEFINAHKLNNIISFYGFINNPYPILNNSNIIIIPSKWEGFGLVAAEATVLGVRIVASKIGGLINIVSNKCGVLCDSEEEFVEKTIAYLNSSDYSKKYDSNLCLADISVNCDINKWKEKFLSVWKINN